MSTDENTELLQKPLLIFDGDCGFCRLWITRWKEITGEAVDYAPYQAVAPRFPKIPMDSFRRSVQLVTSDGVVMSGAEAVFSTLAAGGMLTLAVTFGCGDKNASRIRHADATDGLAGFDST
jgi:predicted DCC family thiol-disulfide oxidoreductase YuxK